MVWINKCKVSHRGGGHVRASHSFSPPSVSLLFFGLYFHLYSFPKWPPGVHLFPMAACLFLQKQTPVLSFSHVSPPLLSLFSVCSTPWFTFSLTTPFLSPSFSPLSLVPLLNREWRAPVLGGQECALWLALEHCYDLNRKSPPCSSPHSHQRCLSQRVSLARLHTWWSQSSSNPPAERQLGCNDDCSSSLSSLLSWSIKESAQRKTFKPT